MCGWEGRYYLTTLTFGSNISRHMARMIVSICSSLGQLFMMENVPKHDALYVWLTHSQI